MQVYDWPGNVRELERLIEGAITLASGDRITIGDLPEALRTECAEAIRESIARGDTMRAWGARYARLVLDRCEQNKRKACRILDISYHTLVSYLQWKPDQPSNQPAPDVHDADDESEDDVRFDAGRRVRQAGNDGPAGRKQRG